MTPYIYQQAYWPDFRFGTTDILPMLTRVHQAQGRLIGRMEQLGFGFQQSATQSTLTQEIVKSSEIEGVVVDPEAVRSSIGHRLGLDTAGLSPSNRYVDGLVDLTFDATQHFAEPLTATRLWRWHALLFPTGHTEYGHPLAVGQWRTDAAAQMLIVSGQIGRERVHFEAPPAAQVASEMDRFLAWFEAATDEDWVLRAAMAHLWFVTIHPVDDGNGRLARAITELALCRSVGTAQRFYGMSDQIRRERKTYYEALERTQHGTLDITGWIEWFLGCLARAIAGADVILERVLLKARFRTLPAWADLNARQREVLDWMIDQHVSEITALTWSKHSNYGSKDAALSDIHDLIARKILRPSGKGGRSASYVLVDPPG